MGSPKSPSTMTICTSQGPIDTKNPCPWHTYLFGPGGSPFHTQATSSTSNCVELPPSHHRMAPATQHKELMPWDAITGIMYAAKLHASEQIAESSRNCPVNAIYTTLEEISFTHSHPAQTHLDQILGYEVLHCIGRPYDLVSSAVCELLCCQMASGTFYAT